MKKIVACFVLFIMVTSSAFCAIAENIGEDYSWLDDMTINQLKKLDAEIHKRIPYESQETVQDAVALIGTWKTNVFGIDCYIAFKDDGSCILASSAGQVVKGKYQQNGTLITVSSNEFHLLAGTWEITGSVLKNSIMNASAVRTDEAVSFSLLMNGSSMSSVINDQDLLKVKCCDLSEINRFDIVVVNYPGREETLFVKRVVGLPGDIVELRDGYLYINGEKYDEPYIEDEYRSGPLNTKSAREVPEGCCFVLGDYRNNSYDSRSVGALPAEMLVGTVIEINGEPVDVVY